MNARAKVLPSGDVAIPKDVRERLEWEPGTPLELIETRDGISLRRPAKSSPFPPKTLEDLRKLPRYEGKPQPIEAISRLSNEDILRLLK
ncbi:MAG TPA: AbrB/MazE/SpoVT family DNA-binding domain-containing protein [Allosphingosinicella sp.]|jgi:AbrB family looped-hinge helix DNA binding protein|nr:AbrB/MazE/SpoVT family DNA-binding domain-containing protein [Allosphingosinicella sp.]